MCNEYVKKINALQEVLEEYVTHCLKCQGRGKCVISCKMCSNGVMSKHNMYKYDCKLAAGDNTMCPIVPCPVCMAARKALCMPIS